MTREWKWKSKSGSAYFHAGCGTQDAVGAEKPSEAIPLQEGVRILFGRGVDHVWFLSLIGGLLFLLLPRKQHRRKKFRRNIAGIRRMF